METPIPAGAATLEVKDNVATYTIPPGKGVMMDMDVNNPKAQYLSFSQDGGKPEDVTIKGADDYGNKTYYAPPDKSSKVNITFDFDSNGTKKPCALSYIGPLYSPPFFMAILTVENGDDTDYDDVIVNFSTRM